MLQYLNSEKSRQCVKWSEECYAMFSVLFARNTMMMIGDIFIIRSSLKSTCELHLHKISDAFNIFTAASSNKTKEVAKYLFLECMKWARSIQNTHIS